MQKTLSVQAVPPHDDHAAADATVSRRWATFIDETRFETLPAAIVDRAKIRILDGLATAIDAHGLPVPETVLAFAGGQPGPSTVIGYARRLPAVDAAFVNATLVNGSSRDDFLEKSHPCALVLPAALAVAEERDASGRDLIAALVAGYEITGRAYLGGPRMLPRFRASGVAGAVGAAAAAGHAMRLTPEQLSNALGCAAVFASGFGAGFVAGTMDVKLNVGIACRNGLTAAGLARAGATATPLAFEGASGFYEAFALGTEQVSAAVSGLGERYLIEDVVYKECPVCIFTQTPIHLARELAAAHRLGDPAEIESVVVTAPEATYTNPGFTNPGPIRNQLPIVVGPRHCTAAALLGRPVEQYDFYDRLDDEPVNALAARIELRIGDPARGDEVVVEVRHRGRVLRAAGAECETLRPSADKVIAKFRRLTDRLGPPQVDRLLDAVLSLDRLDSVRTLTRLLNVDARSAR